MDLKPLFDAGPIVQIHILAAFLAIGFGASILWRRKGTRVHKTHGKVWIFLMVVVALSSFFINEIQTFGPFSAIHILSVVTLYSLVQAVISIKKGDIRRHQLIMQGLFYGGLIGAGIFTFIPGRILYRTFFGNPDFYLISISNVWIIPFAFASAVGAILYWRTQRTR